MVVAVYNTGPDLLQLIHSLDVQTLPQDQFEVLLVDDGSSDDTPALLREVARTRPNVHVHTIENSGWPGRPRNVGLDNAQGEFVFFSDHDDQLYPRALERMYETARAGGTDIVYGRVVRTGRSTPYWPLAAADLDRAPVQGDVVLSRTVHKLFRKAFLVEHGIRFMEGRVRLEDHVFMAYALSHASAVSVVASEPCYRWVHRSDGSNSSDQAIDPDRYWPWYVRQLEVLDELNSDGQLLDDARVTVVTQAFSRFAPKRYLSWAKDRRQSTFDAVRPVVEHLPPRLDAQLPALKRLRVQALRDGDRTRFDRLQKVRTGFTFPPRATSVHWDGDRLVVEAAAELLGAGDGPLRLARQGEHLLLPLPGDLAATDDDRRLLAEEAGTLELTIRDRATGLEWPLPCEQQVEVADTAGAGATTAVTCRAEIDVRSAVFGEPLGPGTWDILARVQFLGENVLRRLPLGDARLPETGPAELAGLSVRVTGGGNLSLTLSPDAAGRPTASEVGWDADRLRVRLDPAPAAGAVLVARVRGADADPSPLASAPARDGVAVVSMPATSVGQIVDLSVLTATGGDLRVAYAGPDERSRLPLRVYQTQKGSLSVKHEGTIEQPAADASRPSLWKRFRGRRS
ncbi:MAG: glycosyltransferase [Angustibacter sp.]